MTTNVAKTQWQYLEKRPHSWRQQLYIKGRKLTAFTVWSDMIVNEMTPEEVADSKELPLAAVLEAIEYCETHEKLLQEEADAERRYLEVRGVDIEPKVTY
ncbi:MAG: hypothetical protein EWV76_10685 [Microcystis novacekii Mn_MB_F_20050700_S1]|jgi:uncharacterized protein (DUF433 family)|uniref:DUF433 domain-containing protein n=1 Tax=Microcystis novacekii Mn_MB_F_20050700_S1D TaxID=2486266 RepID=A0A552J4V1_9CHRO|nr:MAG: hypothetical protein EWV76_10685 [Microcystis novacekii Mn_MB_F_20050700_S1]TRU90787.1 MAG: hypothetical protein EWV54_06325 [Microcystis novacekii Mn_MB_F_20050700_S1D]